MPLLHFCKLVKNIFVSSENYTKVYCMQMVFFQKRYLYVSSSLMTALSWWAEFYLKQYVEEKNGYF